MSKNNFKRSLFFWVDKLQISKRERISITVLFSIILFLFLLNIFIKPRVVPIPENHAEILAEFNRRSALIEREKLEIEKRYEPSQEVVMKDSVEIENSQKTTALISLNNASANELETLPGIGSAYAQRIIEYRQTNGEFRTVDDLVKVRGIGNRTLEKIKPFIKL